MNKGIFTSTFVYMISYSLTRFVGFLLLPLYTNILSPAEFGNYSLLMASYAILNVLYQAGLLQGITSFFFNDRYARERVVSTTFIMLTVLCLIFSIALTITAKQFSRLILSDTSLTSLVVLLVWVLFIDNLSFFNLQILKIERRAFSVAVCSAISAVVNIALNVTFLLYLKLGVAGIILSQAASGAVLFTISSPALISYLKGLFKSKSSLFDKKLALTILRFSLPFVFAGVFGILMDVADRFLIDRFMNREAVGLYSFAYKVGSVMGIFIIAFRTAYLPDILSQQSSPLLQATLKKTFTRLIALMSILFLTVILFIDDVSSLRLFGRYLVNPDYIEAIYLIPFILMAYIFNGLASFFSVSPYITGKTYHFIISDALGLLVNVTLNFLLIPRYGIAGAAASTLIGFMAATVYQYFVFIFSIGTRFSFGKILLILCGALLITIGSHYISGIILRALMMTLYILACWQILPEKDSSHITTSDTQG